MQFQPGEKAVQFRNTIRLTVAVASTGALAIGVSMFHTGGDLQTPGNLVRASLVALALVIASLVLEVGRGIDALATGQAARFQGYEDQIERDAERVRKLWIVGQVMAWLLIIIAGVLIWYFNNSITTLLFGTPDTRFIVSMWRQGPGPFIYVWLLLAAVEPVRFGLLLLLAKDCHFGAARVASQQETAFEEEDGRYYIPVSRIVYFRVFFAALAACLLANVILAVSYVRITDRGIGLVDSLGTTEVYHPWADVYSITERHFIGGGESQSYPAHNYTIQFSDGSEWKSDTIPDDSSCSNYWLCWDARAAIEFAANRANLPVTDVPYVDPYRRRN